MYHDSNIVEPTAIWIPAEAGMTMDGHVCHTKQSFDRLTMSGL